jgi:CRP-like cAMP-binding protein
MPMSAALKPGSTGNLFLDNLAPNSAALLLPRLARIKAAHGLVIADPGMPLKHVMFPIGSVISAVTRMQDGTDVEVTLIGREGLYGFHLALGHDTSATAAMVQIPDSMWRITGADFRTCLRADPELNQRVLNYAMVNLETIAQFSGCNRLHPINERLARWLLMAHDRVVGDELMLTHEFLATMLGVRRPGVSLAASALDQAGVIQYRYGRIVIMNRGGLELATCECYMVANKAIERLLGYSIRKRVQNGETSGQVRSIAD